jgi:predicted AlkP superfamily pyrophosphatase or phosphodiesterase
VKKKLLIVQVAALSRDLGLTGLTFRPAGSVFPAVTSTVQASFRTASPPAKHGMVSNGLFFRHLRRPMFWEQSASLVQGPRIWEGFRRKGKRVAMLFWQQSLGEDVDIVLSPAPIHKHHGGMVQDCYGKPSYLYQFLCKRIGRPFKLGQYWGPMASWKVGKWVVDATCEILKNPDLRPDLCLTYVPTLDYDLQRKGPQDSASVHDKVAEQLERLKKIASQNEYELLIFGDYQIAPVTGAVLPNVVLRKAGLMDVRMVSGMAYPDFYASRAFAVADHEVAHVYVREEGDRAKARKILSELPGVAQVLDGNGLVEVGLKHENSGDLVLVAEQGKWIAYPWWLERREAPEFAGHVDIHNKPGYDPCELFLGWPPGSVSQNNKRIRGSHGRVGPGREVRWAATFPIPNEISDLIQLAAVVKGWLDEGGYEDI